MVPQVSQLIKPLLRYSLESNHCYLKREISNMNLNKGVSARMLSFPEDWPICYCHFTCRTVKNTLIYSPLSRHLTVLHFINGYFLPEKRTKGRCLNGQFLTNQLHLNGFCSNVDKGGLNDPLISQNWASGTTRRLNRLPKIKSPRKVLSSKGFHLIVVVWEGIEPPTQRFSVFCSTN